MNIRESGYITKRHLDKGTPFWIYICFFFVLFFRTVKVHCPSRYSAAGTVPAAFPSLSFFFFFWFGWGANCIAF